jgi:hypothetical protein
MTDQQQQGTTDDDPTTTTSSPSDTGPPRDEMVLARMGGRKGFVYSSIPVVVFVAAILFFSLTVTLTVAVLTGVGLTVFRIVSGERWTSAVGSLVGVAIAAGVVALTGSAKNYFALGIWAYFAGVLLALAPCRPAGRRSVSPASRWVRRCRRASHSSSCGLQVGPAGPRVLQLLQHEHGGALAEHEAVTGAVERPGGVRGVVVAWRRRSDGVEAGPRDRRDGRVRGARDHDVGRALA